MGERAKFPPDKVKAWATTAPVEGLLAAVHHAAALIAATKSEEFKADLQEIIDAAKYEVHGRCWRKKKDTEGGGA